MKRLFIPLVLFVFVFTSCNRISSGDKRLKLEFLYTMKAQLTSMMDYSFRLTKYERVFEYKKDIRQIKDIVGKTEPPTGWDDGKDFKKDFLNVIDEDTKAIDSVETTEGELRPNVKAIIERIKHRQDSLMEELDKVISKVDKE